MAVCTVSCSDEVLPADESSVELKATFPSYVYDDATRVTFNDDLSSFAWDVKDQMRVGYFDDNTLNSSTAIYTTMNGGQVATFKNEGFKFMPNSSYVAAYPIGYFRGQSDGAIDFSPTYMTQVQEANGSISHIGKATIMTALLTTDEYGMPTNSTLEFMIRNCVVKLNLTVDEGTYTKVEIKNEYYNAIPIYLLNQISNYGSAKDYPSNRSSTNSPITLKLGENGFTTDGQLTLYFANTLLSDSRYPNFTMKLYNANGIVTEYTFGGKQFESGKVYQFKPTKIEK